MLNEIIENPKLPPGPKLLWITLRRYDWNGESIAFPSTATLAKNLATTERTVRRWMAELVNLGLVERQSRCGATNTYHTSLPRTDLQGVQNCPLTPDKNDRGTPDKFAPPTHPFGEPSSPTTATVSGNGTGRLKDSLEEDSTKKTPPLPPQGGRGSAQEPQEASEPTRQLNKLIDLASRRRGVGQLGAGQVGPGLDGPGRTASAQDGESQVAQAVQEVMKLLSGFVPSQLDARWRTRALRVAHGLKEEHLGLLVPAVAWALKDENRRYQLSKAESPSNWERLVSVAEVTPVRGGDGRGSGFGDVEGLLH